MPRKPPTWAWALLMLSGFILGLVAQSSITHLLRSADFLTHLASAELSPPARDDRADWRNRVGTASSEAPAAEGSPIQDFLLSVGDRSVRARIYLPPSRHGIGVVVAHGIHHHGIDEARLVPFARQLAAAGFVVLTPELPELADYRITHASVDVLTQAVLFLGEQQSLVTSPQVGLLGFSFGGGLSLLAAAEPELESHLRFVASVGGYHDLERVLRFYVSGEIPTPNGVQSLRPHEYGLVVFAYGHIDQLVPPQDTRVMRRALRAWLKEDRDTARNWASQRTTEAADRLFRLLEEQRLGELRSRFEELIQQDQDLLTTLSPMGSLKSLKVPVHLLHSADDTVIPPSETRWASLELGSASHSTLVSPLLGHANLESFDSTRSLQDRLELLWFMSELL